MNKSGLKSFIIDPLSHCSQLIKLSCSSLRSSQVCLYAIDCVGKFFQLIQYTKLHACNFQIWALLRKANNDATFWDKSYEVMSFKIHFLLEFAGQDNFESTNYWSFMQVKNILDVIRIMMILLRFISPITSEQLGISTDFRRRMLNFDDRIAKYF